MTSVIGVCVLVFIVHFAGFWLGYWFRGRQERKYRKNRPRSFDWEKF